MRLSKELLVPTNIADVNFLNESPYDYTKWNAGRGIIHNSGITPDSRWLAPDFSVIRPMEESTSFATNQIWAYTLNSDTVYVFGIENATTASATRRVHLWEIARKTTTSSWRGFITLTLATATAHTVRDFKIDLKEESTGTVAVSGTAVTGTSTQFATNKVAVGARIGFGSTDPSQITTWYRIQTRTSDTALVLTDSAGTITAGTPYVIQEFRPIYVATNATATNGGIHYAKGVSIEDFISTGTTIPLATTVDDVKAVYWLKNASTQTNTVSCGAAMDRDTATPTNLNLYVLNSPSAGNYNVFKYNIRTPLTVTSGNSVSAWELTTGTQAVTGTISQNANCVYANAQHGLGNGVPSIYFVTTTRWYRAALSGITSGNTNWQSNNITEIPSGGASTFTATGALSTVEYINSIDAFVVGSTFSSGQYSYVTKFVSSGQQFDKIWGRDLKLLDQSLKDSNHPSLFSSNSTAFSFTEAGGNRVFACKQGTTAALNQIYVMAFGADWDYASITDGRLISPEITTPNALKYWRVFANQVSYLGNTSLGKTTEPYRILVRTANIQTDSTTGWVDIDETNSLSFLAGASSIQFAIEFKTIGENCLPARILGINFSYEDNTNDSHFAFSEKTSTSPLEFIWYFQEAFGGTVPALRVNIYDVNTGNLLLSDITTNATSGTFTKSTNGGSSYGAYNTTDRGNNETYIKYVPTNFPSNIRVAAYLVQA